MGIFSGIIDEFYKVFDAENAGKLFLSEDGVKRRRRMRAYDKRNGLYMF